MIETERFSRQRDVVPAERLAECNIAIVGVGALGRQVALQLAAVGAPRMMLIDFDVVEQSNLASQGYLEADLGRPKVQATAEQCRRINSRVEIIESNDRFRRSMDVGNVVFACVDKIDARKIIWDSVKGDASFFGDGRMTAEVIRILTASDADSRQHYGSTLFPQAEAYAGDCTSRMTVFTGNIAAGILISQFSRWLRELPASRDLTLNLLADELSIL
ncbi:MAG: ThiF family adenylyltransferase [Phycisphaerae bacterium]|jgi:sulfur carrier protein ThiS adenylyltransferase|nr:ThiF family adenylyltransferase [Phycisphaerae bacterium]